MRRRALIAAIGITASTSAAGCFSVGGGCTHGRSVTFDPIDPAAIADRESHGFPDEGTPPVLNALLDRALETDPFAIEATTGDPLGWVTRLRTDSGFYELTSQVLVEDEIGGPRIRLRRDEGVSTDPPAVDTLAYGDLPLQDRLRIAESIRFPAERITTADRDRGFESNPIVLAYLDADTDSASRIAGGVDAAYLRIGDGYAAIDEIDDGTTSVARFRYETDLITRDTDEFVAMTLDDRGVTLEAPPPEVASLLETVRDEEDGHLDVCDEEDRDDPHRDAADALEAYLDDLDSDVDGELEYARYEGEWHRIDVSDWVV